MNENSKKMMRKGSASVLALLIAMSTVACQPGGPGGSEGYELWGAPSVENVLRNEDASKYEAIKTEAKISVDTAKNEYESAQVIISADGAVNEYTVELSDLKLVGGDETYAKENISAYNVKYMYVDTNWNPDGRIGWYPDMLLPFDKAIEFGENKIEAGNNQSVFFTFNTPDDQAAGTYTGTVTLTVDGEKNEIPVSLRVRGVKVNEANHVKSNARVSMFYRGEYESTQNMLDIYNKFLIDYRFCPAYVLSEGTKNKEMAEFWADKAYEVFGGVNVSTIPMVLDLGEGGKGIPAGQLEMYLTAIFEKSLEKNCDLVAKCYTIGIDEPASASGDFNDVVKFSQTWDSQKATAIANLTAAKATYLEQYPNVTEEFYAQLLKSAEGISHVTTVHKLSDYEPYVDVFCPGVIPFETGLATGAYEDEEEVWIYTATSPKGPYHNMHLDRNTTLHIQMLGWLMSLYNIEGYLLAGTCFHAGKTDDTAWLEDYYSNPYRTKAPGDGILSYPGAKYGINGPIPTIRIESVRDTFEDYELFYNIKETYNTASARTGLDFDATETMESLMGEMHSNMMITATSDMFEQSRASLLDLAAFTQTGVCFTKANDNGEGVLEYDLYVPNGVEVTATGAEKVNERAVTDGKVMVYRVDMNAANAVSKVTFKATLGEESYEMSYNLPKTVTVYAAETLESGIKGAETSLVNASDYIDGASGKLLKLSLSAAEDNTVCPRMEYVNATVFESLNNDIEKVVFKFWYEGTEEIPLNVYVKYQKKQYEETLTSVTIILKPGENIFEWKGLSSLNWEKSGTVQSLTFEIGEYGSAARSNVYLKNMSVYEKGDA